MMCDTPSVVRRIVASYFGTFKVVGAAVEVARADVVAVGEVVVVSAEVGSGIDSGPSPGEHAEATSRPAMTSRLQCTTSHRARSGAPHQTESHTGRGGRMGSLVT